MSRLSQAFRVGALEVVALSDGAPDRALGGFFNKIAASEWTKAIGITDPEQPVPFNFGAFLVRGDGRTIMIDSGYGPPGRSLGVPGGGELLARLSEIGVSRGAVDVVVHTHLHPDHCGWDLDPDAGGAPTFPNATVYVSQVELDYWTGAATDANPMAGAARTAMETLGKAGRVTTFSGEHPVSASLTMVPTPGHTPGHCSVMLASQGEHLLILGDVAHHPVHLEHHDWLPAVDVDPAESQRSRARMAALAADRNAVVTGGHFPILTLGRVRRVDTGYRWEAL